MVFKPFGQYKGQPPLFAPNLIKADNIIGGTITAEELIIAGGTDGIIRSQNFVAGTSGWIWRGDGSAEVNDILVRGDIESGNWSGASPADLSSRDTDADAGYYLDSSRGAAQFEGDLFIGGALKVTDGDNSIVLSAAGWSSTNAILTFNLGASPTNPFLIATHAGGITGLEINGGTTAANLGSRINVDEELITLSVGASGGLTSYQFKATNLDMGTKTIHGTNGAIGAPAYAFDSDTNLGMWRVGADHLGLAMSKMSWKLIDTTGTAANVHYNSSTDLVSRFTSAAKYKSRVNYNVGYLADLELKPAKFYRKDDKAWYFGFIADDLGEQHKLLGDWHDGEIENYDSNALMAVMAAKINKLEAQVAQLLDTC